MRHLFSVVVIAGIGTLTLVSTGCRNIGFHELDVSQRNRASEQTARDVLGQLQSGLRGYFEAKRHYPATTEAHLYDSIRFYMNPPMDPIHLYRNDNGRGSFVAVGGRANRVIYRYPSSVGPGDYTLYWVGVNGVDEEGEGDDINAWGEEDSTRRLERRRLVDLTGDNLDEKLVLTRTGTDLFRDSVRFDIRSKDSLLYSDSWPLSAYFRQRPDLSEIDRKHVVHAELERFFTSNAFVRTDSLRLGDWAKWAEVKPRTDEVSEIAKTNELMFDYYTGDRGSKGVAWVPSKKKFLVVWSSGPSGTPQIAETEPKVSKPAKKRR